jgi:hypothetical protein
VCVGGGTGGDIAGVEWRCACAVSAGSFGGCLNAGPQLRLSADSGPASSCCYIHCRVHLLLHTLSGMVHCASAVAVLNHTLFAPGSSWTLHASCLQWAQHQGY